MFKYLGREGYRRLAAQVAAAKQRLTDGIGAIEGMYVFQGDLMPLAPNSTIDRGCNRIIVHSFDSRCTARSVKA